MTSKSTFILSFIFLLISTSLFAQEQGKDVTITASGNGSTQSEAQQMALRSATEQAFGAFISSKTEIFNDQLVADQMSSVSSGNIKSFEVLSESQLPNGTWASTIKAIVSVDKLTSFVQAKGVVVEVKGGLFAVNIKQQILNEEGEVKAVADMVGLLHETMQTAFDYEIQTKDPVSLDAENKNWSIGYEVTATTNKNMEFCSEYFIKTIKAIGLSVSEVENYTSLKKEIFPFIVRCYGPTDPSNGKGGVRDTIYLRKSNSIRAINALLGSSGFYSRLFTVKSGIATTNGDKIDERARTAALWGSIEYYSREYAASYSVPTMPIVQLPKAGVTLIKFKSSDRLTLEEIEKITKYTVTPRGVVSPFKHGGYVVYEENGKGLVCSIIDVQVAVKEVWGKLLVDEANKPSLSLNGYNDWELPTEEESTLLNENIGKKGIGNLKNTYSLRTGYTFGNTSECRLVRRFGESTIAVSANASASTTGNEANNSESEKSAEPAPASTDSITYVNSLQCRLVIRNKKENSFEYTLYNQCQVGSCAGLDDFVGEASSNQTEPAPEKRFEEPGAMIFIFLEDGKTLILEPDPSFIGFDCAGEFDNSFELQIKP